MSPHRVIARLDIKGANVIKGIHLEGLRIVGKPGELALRYYEQGIDEIIYMDTVASLYGRNSILNVVEEAARDIFVPLTVGGGIRTVTDIVTALRSGADKVAINTAAITRPAFIDEASRSLGSQCIVLSVEAKRRAPGKWEALTDNGREPTGIDVMEWVAEAEQRGAGEILITSVDQEGTKKGADIELFSAVRQRVKIPVIGSGGIGTAMDAVAAFKSDAVDAIACASIFHYDACTVPQFKAALAAHNVPMRQ